VIEKELLTVSRESSLLLLENCAIGIAIYKKKLKKQNEFIDC